jgi:hypothetical protein
MDEGDLETEHAPARSLVDQLGTLVREMREGGVEVLDLIRDVVHPRAALREEATDGRVLAEGAQQLEPALAHADGRRLDALLLHARALLDPGAEEALVRVERAVEIFDGQADVMDGARRVHVAIVFERLAATMRALALALVVTVVLLAGCGGSKPAAPPNDEASKPADQVLADAKAAATGASSAHVEGQIVSNGTHITLDLSLARDKGAKGSVSINGLGFDLVKIGDTAYVKGSDAFYRHFAGSTIAQLIHGKWIKAPTTSKQFRPFAALASVSGIFAEISAHHGKLVNDGKTTYKGQPVVVIRDTSDDSKLYVAATGKPYPVALIGGRKSQSGTVTFSDWNEPVSLSAPSGALDVSKFLG